MTNTCDNSVKSIKSIKSIKSTKNINKNDGVNVLKLLKLQNQHSSDLAQISIADTYTHTNHIKECTRNNIFQISYNNIIIIASDVTDREKNVLRELIRFYTVEKLEIIKPLINQEHDISLRLIDWTLTNYGKKKCVKYPLPNGKIVDVHESYKNYMSSYSRNTLFDLFRRGKCLKVIYGHNHEHYIISSVKQLNSFRCVLEINLLDYIRANKDKIEEDHRMALRRSADNKKCNSRKKRQELSSSIYKKCLKHTYKVTITF